MSALVVPCHACGSDNPVAEFHCGNSTCNAVIRLQLVETTQYLPTVTAETDANYAGALQLAREAYLVAGLLLLSAYRLSALIQVTAGEGKV